MCGVSTKGPLSLNIAYLIHSNVKYSKILFIYNVSPYSKDTCRLWVSYIRDISLVYQGDLCQSCAHSVEINIFQQSGKSIYLERSRELFLRCIVIHFVLTIRRAYYQL